MDDERGIKRNAEEELSSPKQRGRELSFGHFDGDPDGTLNSRDKDEDTSHINTGSADSARQEPDLEVMMINALSRVLMNYTDAVSKKRAKTSSKVQYKVFSLNLFPSPLSIFSILHSTIEYKPLHRIQRPANNFQSDAQKAAQQTQKKNTENTRAP